MIEPNDEEKALEEQEDSEPLYIDDPRYDPQQQRQRQEDLRKRREMIEKQMEKEKPKG